nr:nuclease-related domain-containing protein [Lysinibacillus timonensis]
MILKERTESPELQIFKALNNRMSLLEKDKQYYFNLKKGYEGELLFDSYIKKVQSDCLIINDLLLKFNNSTFQIDTLILMADSLFIFEVKNFDGDFYYESNSDKIFTKSKVEIVNPMIQLKRTESLLRQLLHSLGFTITINSSIVFVNPEVTLYQAPIEAPFIFPTQLNRLVKQLNGKYSKITEKHKLIANKLLSLNLKESPHSVIPDFEYEKLEKGITCEFCHSFLDSIEGRKCVCKKCGHVETVASAVIRSVREFKLLFPDRKITTNLIHEWCNIVESKKRVQRILESNFSMVGKYRWAFFE